jgi:hypothetical protein
MLWLLNVYRNPVAIISLALAALLITTGVQTKRASVLSLGIYALLFPIIFISLLASNFYGENNKTKTILASSTSVIILIAFLITRRF